MHSLISKSDHSAGYPLTPSLNKGETPSAVAKNEGIRKILETKKQKYCWIFKMLGFLPLKKQK